MKLYKDLRGVGESCNDKRSYNIMFETLFDLAFFVTFRSSGLFNVMQKTVEAYHDNDDLCGTMLKCLIAFV